MKVCCWVSPCEFLHTWAATCTQFSLQWYTDQNYDRVVVVPDDTGSLNSAINMLSRGVHAMGRGLVLIRPGVYSESVRITQNCHLLGLGPREKVVVEAPGWESALVSAGLGGTMAPAFFGWSSFSSGEDACIENITFRCRNELMKGRCVYLVMGRLQLIRCNVQGGVVVCGSGTAPCLKECHISKSRGNGVHLTDHCRAVLRDSVVANHGRHGILIDRQSCPEVVQNSICKNAVCGIQIFRTSEPDMDAFRDNCFEDNGEAEISFSPHVFQREDSDPGSSVDEEP